VDRHPSVSSERLIAQLTPPPTFADVSFATYHPDPAEPTQAATMHPSRYLTLIEGVTAVFLIGVHGIDDQNVALRLVALSEGLRSAGS
jgi:cell division protein ZapE